MYERFFGYIILLSVCICMIGCTTKNEVVIPESNMDLSPTKDIELTTAPITQTVEPSPTKLIPTQLDYMPSPTDTIPTPTIAPIEVASLVRSEVEEQLITMHGEMDEVKTVYFLDYIEADNTILVQNIEWLTSWDEEDSKRIQELLDAGKITIGEDFCGEEYYIYSKPDDTEVYHISDDIKIVLRGGTRSIWSYYDLSTLSEIQDLILMDLYIKEDNVYMIYEPYTP